MAKEKAKRGPGRPRTKPISERAVIYVEAPPALKESIQALATRERRTFSAQVILLLEQAMQGR